MNVLFIDCEQVTITKYLKELEIKYPTLYDSQLYRVNRQNISETITISPEEYQDLKAKDYPEYNKFIVVSFGYFDENGEWFKKTYVDEDEKTILEKVGTLITNMHNIGYRLCGHAIKSFDLPQLCKRFMVNGLNVPKAINSYYTKPQDTTHIDTSELQSCGYQKEKYTPLDWICTSLNIETSKDKIKAHDINNLYQNNNNINSIIEYCEKDIYTTALVYKKIMELY